MLTKVELAKTFKDVTPCGLLGRVVNKLYGHDRWNKRHNPLWVQTLVVFHRNRHVAKTKVY